MMVKLRKFSSVIHRLHDHIWIFRWYCILNELKLKFQRLIEKKMGDEQHSLLLDTLLRGPDKELVVKSTDGLLDSPQNRTRADMRKSTRSVRNSNESDVTRKSAATPRDAVRSTRPSFETELSRKSATTPRDGVRSTRPSFESDARRSANTPRDGVRSTRPSFESDITRRSANTPCDGVRSTRPSFELHSNDELHLREYVDAVVHGDLDNVQRGIEVCRIDPNYCGADGFNALFAAR